MRRFPLVMTIVGVAGISAAVVAQGQERTASPVSKGMLALVRVASDVSLLNQESVQKELKLSPEQIAKLNELRSSVSFRTSRTADGDRSREEEELEKRATNAAASLVALLQPDQRLRLKQISWQQTRRRGLLQMLGVEEFRQPLQLTAEQISRVDQLRTDPKYQYRLGAAGRGSGETTTSTAERIAAGDQEVEKLLTAEQNSRIKDLLGPTFEGELRRGFPTTSSGGGGGGGRGPGPGGGGQLAPASSFRLLAVNLGSVVGPATGLLGNTAVQRELKLTQEQLQKAAPLQSLTRDDPAPALDFLTPEQNERLSQLSLQYAIQRYGPIGALHSAATLNVLALTAEQQLAVKALAEEDRSAIAALGAQPTDEKIRSVNREIQEKLDRTLNDEQRSRLKSLHGETYRGVLSTTLWGGRFSATPRQFRVGSVSRNSSSYVELPDVQTDLKLTEEQRSRIAAAPMNFGLRDPDEVQKILTAEQSARLSQIHLQILGQRNGPAYIFRYSDVTAALKLTDAQKDLVQKLGQTAADSSDGTGRSSDRSRQQLDEILTEEQRTQLKQLLGEPYRGAGPPSRSRTPARQNAANPPSGT